MQRVLQEKEPAGFSNKQWKAKAHQRKCVACAGGHAASAVGTTSDGGIVLASAEPAVQQDTHNGPFAPCDEMMAFLHATLRRWQHDRIAVVDLAHGEIKTLADLNYTKACANRDYTSQRYLRAIEGYSSILSYITHGRGELPRVLEQLRVTCLANRAMSLLKLARNSDAVNDCMECWQSLALHDTLGLRAKVLRRLELAGRPPSKEALATAKFAACEPRPVTIVTDEDVDKLVCRLRQYTHKKLSRDVLNRLLQVMGSHVDAAFMVVSNYLHDYGQEASSKRSNARERARETGGVFLTDTDLDAIEELLGLTGILQQQRAQEQACSMARDEELDTIIARCRRVRDALLHGDSDVEMRVDCLAVPLSWLSTRATFLAIPFFLEAGENSWGCAFMKLVALCEY